MKKTIQKIGIVKGPKPAKPPKPPKPAKPRR